MNKKTFFNLLFSSVKLTTNKYPNSIFYCYNKSIERQLKYNKLFNLNNPINYSFNVNDIVFEQNTKKKYLWVEYKIWNEILIYNQNIDMYDLISDWLLDDSNWKKYTAHLLPQYLHLMNEDNTNWKQYTPTVSSFSKSLSFDDAILKKPI